MTVVTSKGWIYKVQKRMIKEGSGESGGKGRKGKDQMTNKEGE